MPMRAPLSDAYVFEPEAIQAMSTAFELSCADLHVFPDDQRGRETIATRIIALARIGIVDAENLHLRVMAKARPSA